MNKSIYMPAKQHLFAEGFRNAGLEVSHDPAAYSDFVYTTADTAALHTELQTFGAQHGIAVPNYELCDKGKAPAKFAAAGFAVLDTVNVLTRSALEEFPHDTVILKPAVACTGSARGHTLDSAIYRVVAKETLLAQLDALGAFTGTLLVDEPCIVQQVADGSDDSYDALILHGAVNGNGEVWHCPPIEISSHFKNRLRNAKTVWDNSNATDETAALQAYVENLLSAENSKNCFYHLQFLRVSNNWVPHDFQFRFVYFVNFYLGGSPYADYKTALIRYAFDLAADKPVLPAAFGLKLTASNPSVPDMVLKDFVTGASKAEVLGLLENM